MTNYYTNTKTTANEFFNAVCMNHIRHGKQTNESVIHVLIWNLSINVWDILETAKANGYNARLYKSRTLVISL